MITPRPYQLEAIDSVWNYFLNGHKGNPLILMPTATGKSIVIAFLIKRILECWPDQRILCLTHVQELIEQNYNKIKEAFPLCPAGIHSAGPNRVSHHPTKFECKWFNFKNICHYPEEGIKEVEKNCRSCKACMADENATFYCLKFKNTIPKDFIKTGCNEHEPIV